MSRRLPSLWFVLMLLPLWTGAGAHAASVTRSLPANFTPGNSFTVSLSASPDDATVVYAVEDHPPTNWTVGLISHGGTFDAGNGKVTWGPFADALPRVLTYAVTPALTVTGTNSFTGQAVFDSDLVIVGGARLTQRFPGTLIRSIPASYLPGTALSVILTAAPAKDAAAWAVEESVPAGWIVGAISHGGGFDAVNQKVKWGPFFDSTPRALNYTILPPASSRIDVTFTAAARFGSAILTDSARMPLLRSALVRNVPATYLPGISFTVALTATPAPYVQVMAIEEAVPGGWTPANISAGGVWDPVNRKLKWGPFIGTEVAAITSSYSLTPADGAARPLALSATARFDDVAIVSETTLIRYLAHSENTLVRTLPAEYSPGRPLTVAVTATPIDTGLVYAVEETVPDGWSITAISDGGGFDAANRKVKWGPFLDVVATIRNLTYQATPPTNSFGTVTFAGTGQFDKATIDVTGATTIDNVPSVVTRSLPARYLPGTPLTVTLTAAPVPGVETYAVEETVPDGWTASALSDGGTYDARNRKLKWGLFLDRDLRPLTYTLTPSTNATGTNTFAGQGWFNGLSIVITGNSTIAPNHAPIAAADLFQRPATNFYKVSVFALLANDSDPDGDFLSVDSVSPFSTQGGFVELDWPWIYYTPPAILSAADTFTYTISDGHGGTVTGTVALTVVGDQGSAQNIVSIVTLPGGAERLRFTGVPGFVYHIQISTNLTTWTSAADRTASSLGQFEYDDATAAAAANPIRFYRTLWP